MRALDSLPEGLQQEPLADGGLRYFTARGGVRLWELTESLLVLRFDGYTEAALAAAFLPHTMAFARRVERFTGFLDLSEISGYDTEVRTLSTEATRAFLPRIGGMHFFVTSRLVAMGVSVANLALGGRLTVHTTRAPFFAALAGALPKTLAPEFFARAGFEDAEPRRGGAL